VNCLAQLSFDAVFKDLPEEKVHCTEENVHCTEEKVHCTETKANYQEGFLKIWVYCQEIRFCYQEIIVV